MTANQLIPTANNECAALGAPSPRMLRMRSAMRGTPASTLLIAATFFATLLCSTVPNLKAATNVLTNPGFESGTLSGWTGYGNAFVESTNNVYFNGGNPEGASNVLTHTGIHVFKTFGQFSGGENFNGVYQDRVAGPGSVWAADGWGLSHFQDLISGGNTAWVEVTFRDPGDAILALYKSSDITPSVTPATWIHLAVTNEVDVGSGVVTNTVSNFAAPAGSSKVRYQVVLKQPAGFDGGSVYFDDMRLDKVAGSDPEITLPPENQSKVIGQTAVFTVTAGGTLPISYQWSKDSIPLVNGGRIAGAASPTLTIDSLIFDDTGSYSVLVSNISGTLSASATLTVQTAEQAANSLVNPGFETGTASPWIRFNGGGLRTTNDTYAFGTTPVSVYEGDYVSVSFNGGEFNGLFQDLPASPGDVFTADGWFLTPTEEQIFGDTIAWMEVQFRSGSTPLALYKSVDIDANTTRDVWFQLQTTNRYAGDFVTFLGTTNYMVAPEGTDTIRVQVTFKVVGGAGSVYYDSLRLLAKLPVVVGTTLDGGNINISFETQAASSYQVLYKDSLSDPTWQVLTTVAGDGTVKTVSDPVGSANRFYRVATL